MIELNKFLFFYNLYPLVDLSGKRKKTKMLDNFICFGLQQK